MARTIGIWICGLIAALTVGGGAGAWLGFNDGGFVGMISGGCAFSCFRLWMGERQP